ncbi:hypothetical protein CsSME_00034382 [Camellia sinensis var. sinensis]
MHMRYYNMDKVMESIGKSPVHSVFLFQDGELPKKPLLGTVAANFKLLKVLDLKDAPLDQLHEELPFDISRLRKLRHLLAYFDNNESESLVGPVGVKIQRGIGGLEELQNLSYVETNHGLIKELEKLRQLRKLGITKLGREHRRALCAAIEKMKYLQHLSVTASRIDGILDLQYISSSSSPQYL